MTVTLNQVALKALLESEEGPVGRFIADLAAQVTNSAQANVRDYFGGAPSLTVDDAVDFDMDGSTAVVGIRDAGAKAHRLAQAQAQGRVNWLLKALLTEEQH